MPENENENETQDTPAIAELRQRAEQAAQFEKDLAKRDREVAFLRAGIDTDTKLGKLFLGSYDGDLTPDAIKAEAKELGITPAGSPPPPSGEGEGLTPEEKKASEERARLAAGSQDDGYTPPPGDPAAEGLAEFHRRIDKGTRREEAAAEFVSRQIDAAVRGDERVIYVPGVSERVPQ